MDTRNLDIDTQVQELLQLLKKSETSTISQILQYNGSNQRCIYINVLKSIKNAIEFNDEVTFGELCRILALISNANISTHLFSYFSYDDNPFKKSNVVIMACKHTRLEILNNIFRDNSSAISDLSTKVGATFPLPTDQDEEGHNAFYYSVRSGNTRLLEVLMKKWPMDYFSSRKEELCSLLSESLNELMLKNVDISIEMQIFIHSFLLDYYFEENPPSESSDYSHDDIQENVSLILECSDLYKTKYANRESKDLLIVLAKGIARNIFTLKKRLKSTYDRIPWEEMEFHLISHIRYLNNQGCYINCCVTETDFLKYLATFSECLENETKDIKFIDIKNLSTFPNKTRGDMINSITHKYSNFEEFYQNYEFIRDYESLSIIKKCVDAGTEVNALEKSGKTVIVRALQVMGENFKNTLESPKLSSGTSDYLMSFLPKETVRIMKSLRNSFSHGFPLAICQEIEEMCGSEFYARVQNDLKSLNVGITSVFQKIKFEIFRTLLKKICDCEDVDVLKDTFHMIRLICCTNDIFQFFPKNNAVIEVEKLVSDLDKMMRKKTHFEKSLFSKIAEIISFEKQFLEISETEFQKHLNMLNLHFTSVYEMNSHSISTKKWRIKRRLNIINPLYNSEGLENINLLMKEIYGSVVQGKINSHVLSLISRIFYIIRYRKHEIKHLHEFRKNFQKTEKITFKTIKNRKLIQTLSYQEILLNDITAIRRLVEENNLSENSIESFFIYKNSLKMQAEVEMLILSILSSLEHSNYYLITSQQYNDVDTPLLVGRYLRNYLAHGNPLVDILMDSTQLIFLFAMKIIKHDIYRKGNITIKRMRNKSNARYTVENQERLFRALTGNSVDEVQHWIKQGADIYGRNSNLMTALHFAAKSSNIDILKFLIDRGLNPKAKDFHNRNILHVSAAFGCKCIVEYIIEELKISVDEKCERKQSPLHVAAENGCFDAVETLLHHRAETDVVDVANQTPLQKAVINNRMEIAKLFLRNNKNINSIRDENGFTLLHIAAEFGFLDMVVYLLDEGADVNSETLNLATPLHLSSFDGQLEAVKILISRGANVSARAKEGVTPLHFAVESGRQSIVEYLLENGANINAMTSEKCLPLHYAIREKHMKIFEILIKNGARLEDIEICGDSAYKYAISKRNLDAINYLIESGVPINQRDLEGCTPLHLSIKYVTNDISKRLIENGADVTAVDLNGFTPLGLAILCGNYDIASTLLLNRKAFSLSTENGITLLQCCASTTKYSAMLFKQLGMLDIVNCDMIASNSDMFIIFKTLVEMATDAMGCSVMKWIQWKNKHGRTALHFSCSSGNIYIVQYLVNKLPHLNIPDEKGYTPLHCAVEFNHLEVVNLLLSSEKCSLNSMTSEGNTALCLASENNYTEVARVLIKTGADVNAGHPLMKAILDGYQEMCLILLQQNEIYSGKQFKGEIDKLLQIASFNGLERVVSYILHNKSLTEDFSLEKSLFCAIECGYEDIVTVFLKHGADVNYIFKNNFTSTLHLAVKRGHSKITKLLLDEGADFNKLDSKNRKPIEWAVWYGRLDHVKIFFQKKTTNVNAKVNGDYTLLHIAAECGHLDIVKFLISENASLRAVNGFSSKPIHLAAREGQLHIVKYFIQCDQTLLREHGCANMNVLHYAAQAGQTDIVKYLIKKGININESGDNGVRPIHLAAMFGFEEVIRVLLSNGAVYDCFHDIFHGTPLLLTDSENIKKFLLMIKEIFHSVKSNNVSNVKLLIDKGACIHAMDSDHATPLHYAAREGSTEIIQLLLEYKANPNAFGGQNVTPLHIASKYGKYEAAKLLLENGAIYNAMSTDRKTPLDLASSKYISDLLKLIDIVFRNVQNCNINILSTLEKVENSEFLKSIAFAKNNEEKTLMTCAVENDFPELKHLESIIVKDFEILSHKIIQLLNKPKYTLTNLNDFQKKTSQNLGTDISDIFETENSTLSSQDYEKLLHASMKFMRNEKEFNVNKADSLKMRSFVAQTMHDHGQNIEALKIFKYVFQQQSEMFGPNDFDTLRTLSCMASVLNSLEHYEEALKAYNIVFEKHLEIYGPDNPLTLFTQSKIGLTLTKLGKYDEALSTYKCVYESRKKVYGPFHANTLRAFHNINSILYNINKPKESVEGLREILNIQEKDLGPNHKDTVRTKQSLGLILFNMGKFLEASKILKENIENLKYVLGNEHSEVLQSEKLIEAMKYPLDDLNLWRSGDLKKTNAHVPTLEELELHRLKTIDSEGRTLLHFAVNKGNISLVKDLLQKKCDFMQATIKGNTALHIASSRGHAEIAELLLMHVKGENVHQLSTFINAKTKNGGNSALHAAANFETAIALLKYGAIYNIQNKDSKTPKDYTTLKEISDFLQLVDELFKCVSIGDNKIMSKLKILGFEEKIAVSNARNELNFTLLQVCLANGHKQLLKQLNLVM
ncbi:uncharacterized protein [Parasteatoda tepidariorum]|uniref:uncharacterized protein n=1 Tax=Parasteatoda tepidariorum TaxID=114398 RepID=UPI001C72632B|nr:uncharacterized protein LOC107449929 [Parasteatoda tepidariorum]